MAAPASHWRALDAGPPHFVRIPARLRAYQPGQTFHHSGEFLVRRRRLPVDGLTSCCSLSFHAPALLLVVLEGFPRQTNRKLTSLPDAGDRRTRASPVVRAAGAGAPD